jgi:hypothetical protein
MLRVSVVVAEVTGRCTEVLSVVVVEVVVG